MADSVTTQIIQNGFRNVILLVNILSDGTGVSGLKIFDAQSATYGVSIGGQLLLPGVNTKLVGLDFDVQDQKFELFWDASVPQRIVAFGSSPEDFDWKSFGGLPCPVIAGATGSILLTTIDPMPDSTLTMILKLRKCIKQ